MVMDIPVQQIFNLMGHDGSELAWPHLKEPFCRRAFADTECVWAAYKLGWAVTMLPQVTVLTPDGSNVIEVHLANFDFANHQGVAYGRMAGRYIRHSVAFRGAAGYDPSTGKEFDLQNQFRAESYYIFDFIGEK